MRNGDVSLAYQVFGGDRSISSTQRLLLRCRTGGPHLPRFLRGLGQEARVIHTDRRGWGCLTDSPGDVAPLEEQVDDLVAVMDAAGSERAVGSARARPA
jgi:pimeloyl-ACP methyl ester carboxylesterase